MNAKSLLTLCLLGVFAAPVRAEDPLLAARADTTGFIRIQIDGFAALAPREQAFAYWMTQAAIAIDPIIYDQLSLYGLREKRLLEGISARPQRIDPDLRARLTQYTRLFWAHRGNHNRQTAQKFLPTFTAQQLEGAALLALQHGAWRTAEADFPPLRTPADVRTELAALRQAIFDADFEPMMTSKSPPPGRDILQASANSFYPGLSLADLQGFKDRYALNSRVVKGADGTMQELVYRAGTNDGRIPPGLYARYLSKAIGYLKKAQALAGPDQGVVIADLIRYYETGERADWIQFDTDWVRTNPAIEFSNGFVEVYRDARGIKGSSAAFVAITDRTLSNAMAKLAANAAYFERQAPWDDKYKRASFRAPLIEVVETLIETGDFHVNTVGDNLPNENEVRQFIGNKNFLFESSARALAHFLEGHDVNVEFAASPAVLARQERYGAEARDLKTALHEAIGHGSGKLSEHLTGGAQRELKEYYSTLEEGRADLMALWNVWDPKLKELGLIGNQEEVAKAMYDRQLLSSLLQLREVPHGDTLEEDHLRDRQLIANYLMATPGAAHQVRREGRTVIEILDYGKAREGVGRLLAELMRIKAEGDYPAIKALVDQYGVHFDTAVRDEVVARNARLHLPVHWAGIYPTLIATLDADANVTGVALRSTRSPEEQYLGFASMYDAQLAPPLRAH